MNTVARPATGESGSLVLATVGSTAASNWIGPSKARSGRRSRTISVAPRTLSTSAPEPEVPVALADRKRRVAAIERALAEMKAAAKSYDAQNKHGESQGAKLDGSIA